MDSWEWNKYAAAILSALVFVLAVHLAANALFTVPTPAKPGYVPPVPEKTVPLAAAPTDAISQPAAGQPAAAAQPAPTKK